MKVRSFQRNSTLSTGTPLFSAKSVELTAGSVDSSAGSAGESAGSAGGSAGRASGSAESADGSVGNVDGTTICFHNEVLFTLPELQFTMWRDAQHALHFPDITHLREAIVSGNSGRT